MYLQTKQTVFCTLAVGDNYREKSLTLIESVLKFTHNDLYVITDKPDAYSDFYDRNRVHYVDMKDLTDLPITYKQGTFNYNLKMVPIKYVVEQVKPALTVYCDADVFIFGNSIGTTFYRSFKEGISCRFRNPLNDSPHQIGIDKLEKMGVEWKHIDTKMPIEHVMFFKNNTMMPTFFNEWYRFAKLSYEKDCISFFESVEMALAIYHSKMPYYHVDNTCYLVDDFRLQHNEKIMKPFVI